MKMFGPLSRFRIYTTPTTYLKTAVDALLLQSKRNGDLRNIEEAIKGVTGLPYAICMPQARVGIFLALRALISPGQKVILSAYTIHDVINMVICAGGVPVFADIDRETCNLNPSYTAELIDENTGAVLVTHLHGLAMEMDELSQVCLDKGVPLIEDASQAFGARLGGQSVGSFGDVGVFSFGMYKNLNSFYGGMVVTRREEFHRRISHEIAGFRPFEMAILLKKVANGFITDVATNPLLFRYLTFPLFRYGYLNNIEVINKRVRVEDNPQIKRTIPKQYLRRMRPLQARTCLRSLPRVEDDSRKRIEFARYYHDGLEPMKELICPPFRDDHSHIYTYYPIQYSDRNALIRHMMKYGCDIGAQHLKNCADLDCFEEFHRDCPNTRATAKDTILLPTYPRYSHKDVKRNIRVIRQFFGRTEAPL